MHMKILFISDVYFPRVNGVSTSIKTFMSQLETLGHTVDLIAPDYGEHASDALSIKRIAARSIYFDPEDRLMKYGEALKQYILKSFEGNSAFKTNSFVEKYSRKLLTKKLVSILDSI